MATVEELLIKLTADNSDLKRKLAESEKGVSSMGGVVSKLGPMIAGAFTVGAIVGFAKVAFRAAEQQEQANKRLMFAVKGNATAFKELTDQAEKLRAATGVDDAAIMQIQQLGANAGYSTEKIKKVTEAAVELASVTGQDLQAAYMQINATFNGSAGRLTRLDAEFGTLTEEQLRNGDAVDLILQKYKGFAAESATETQKLASTWDEMTERFGTVIAPALNKFFSNINKDLNILTSNSLTFWEKFLSRNAATKLIQERQAVEENRKAWRDYDIQVNAQAWLKTEAGIKAVADAMPKATAAFYENHKSVKVVGDAYEDATSKLVKWVNAQNEAYERAKSFAQYDVPIPTFGQTGSSDIKPIGKGITQKGDPSKLLARGQNEFGSAIKKTNSELEDQMKNMQQMNQLMASFGQTAVNAFGEQSNAAKAFAAGQVITNAAVGIMGTWAGYAKFGPFGTALAVAQTAMIGGLAVTQLGKIAGAFAAGGIVGGGSYSGDQLTARVNSGEMILNGNQQRELFAMANGMGGRNQVEVVGYISGDVIRLANKRGEYMYNRRG